MNLRAWLLLRGALAGRLRETGASVEVAPGGRLKRLMELSNKLGARYTLIIGDTELASGNYTLKEMASGEQVEITRDELIKRFSSHV